MITKVKLILRPSATLPVAYRDLRRGGSLFSISNNGRVEFNDDYSGTTAKSVFATLARHSVPGSLAVLNVQTIHGQMHVGWSYYTHVWSDETAEQFVNIFREELDKFGEK